MANAGTALMGIGVASGENRAVEAARMSINSPLLDVSINGARGVLFAIAGSEDMTMNEIQEAAKIITESVDANARVIFGAIIDPKLRKGEIKITVIATGFPEAGRIAMKKPDQIKRAVENESSEEEDGALFSKNDEKFSDAIRKDKDATERAIFHSTPEEKTRVVNVHREEVKTEEDDEDDDLGVIPSFLRRSKLR